MDNRSNEIKLIQQNSKLSQAEKSRQIQALYSPNITQGTSFNINDETDQMSCRICLEDAPREDGEFLLLFFLFSYYYHRYF